ncbi:MAG TPA: PHP domain-containing protein [Nitrospiraceae bacterium]|nr:PHP domain-containing protein [Nitrospiraceae bacterium]
MDKRDIARILKETSFFLLLRGDDFHKARTYHNAGTALLASPLDAAELVHSGRLVQVKGIGPATASVITDLVRTGVSPYHQEVRGSYPSSLMELGDVPGLRTKQIKQLFDHAGIRSIAELQAACRKDDLLSIPGFGPKLQAKLSSALGEYQRGRGYVLYADAVEEAVALGTALENLDRVGDVCLAGAMRRRLEVVNELIFVARCTHSRPLPYMAAALKGIPNVTDVARRSDAVTAVSPRGMPLTVVAATPKDYGLSLLQATGNDEHLHGLRQRLAERGFRDWDTVKTRMAGLGEAEITRAAGLPFIPPELREGQDDLDGAVTDRIPLLVETSRIQGFFHTHTNYSDGSGTVEEMVLAAKNAGFRYLGISDHSQSAFYANGLKEARIRTQWAEIDMVRKKHPDCHIFKGIEADILPDGSMDYPDALLAEFDFVIASVHSRFNLSEEDQTRRICRALANPYVTMLGHPTGRLLLSRPGYRVDLSRVIAAAAVHRKMIEINGSRHRLDLDWRWVRAARAEGVTFCVNPDAHAVDEVANVALGVNVARKAALTAGDIVNTLGLADILARLSSTTQSG